MMKKLRYGNTNTFFLEGSNGGLLIDTDYAGTLSAFFRAIKAAGITVREISYVMATHYHPDHMGLISELMEMDIRLLLIDTQKEHVHFSDHILMREPTLRYKPINESLATIISCEESRSFLDGIGIKGEIISTPSHSADSVSVMLDNGQCFVGDLEHEAVISGYESNEALQNDWSCVMSFQPKQVYHKETIRRYVQFGRQLDKLEDKVPGIRVRILTGELDVMIRYMPALVKMPVENLKEMAENKKCKVLLPPSEFLVKDETKKDVRPKTNIHVEPGIKQMPEFDPDAELNGLRYTIPAWKKAILRTATRTDFSRISNAGKQSLKQALCELVTEAECLSRMLEGRQND